MCSVRVIQKAHRLVGHRAIRVVGECGPCQEDGFVVGSRQRHARGLPLSTHLVADQAVELGCLVALGHGHVLFTKEPRVCNVFGRLTVDGAGSAKLTGALRKGSSKGLKQGLVVSPMRGELGRPLRVAEELQRAVCRAASFICVPCPASAAHILRPAREALDVARFDAADDRHDEQRDQTHLGNLRKT